MELMMAAQTQTAAVVGHHQQLLFAGERAMAGIAADLIVEQPNSTVQRTQRLIDIRRFLPGLQTSH